MVFVPLLVVLAVLIYIYYNQIASYWKSRGVPCQTQLPFFGNIFEIILTDSNVGKYIEKLYYKFQTPYFGFMTLNQPYLVIREPEIIKKILIKDFQAFPDRMFFCDANVDPIMSYSLLGIKNPQWKLLRNSTSPIFTTGKIKAMFSLLTKCSKNLAKHVDSLEGTNTEVGEIAAKYTTDVISTCAFGIEANSFIDENSPLRVAGRKLTKSSFSRSVETVSYSFAHILVKIFKFKFFEGEATKFLTEVFKQTIEHRETNQERRNDLIDYLIGLKNKEASAEEFKFDDEKIVAPALMFFLAGHDATSSTISFTLHNLCVHPDIQERLQKEILEVIELHGGVTYNCIQEMTYLHQVISESLRLHTFTPFLQRQCIVNYKLPGTGLVIERGTNIIIPQHGLHSDPKYFKDPEKFDPERFNEQNRTKLPSCVYMPFGEGPRNCVGERFGLLSVKLGLIYILKEFVVERNNETPEQLTFCRSDLLRTGNGIRVTFRRL